MESPGESTFRISRLFGCIPVSEYTNIDVILLIFLTDTKMVKWFILPVEKKTVPRPSLTGGFCTLTGVPKVLNMNLYIPWKNTSRGTFQLLT